MSGNFRGSAALVWRHQRLLWWIVAINLALAWLSSLPLLAMLRPILDHSLESARLVSGFDAGTFVMLLERRSAPMRSVTPAAFSATIVYLAAMLALDGGILIAYLEDRRLSLGEFGGYCGEYFWRMVRLALYSIVPFGLLAMAQGAASRYGDNLSRNASPERLGFAVKLASTVVIVLLALLVRLWFDLTQARMVQGDLRAVTRQLLRSFVPVFRSGLYRQYLGIALVALAIFAAGIAVWVYLPHQALFANLLVLEVVTIAQIGARLWMKASSARWAALEADESSFAVAMVPVPAEASFDPPESE